jgi:hypothetical protein
VANWINSAASLAALHRFTLSKLQKRPLIWVKTEHQYPSAAALMCDRRRIGEILTGGGYISTAQLDQAIATKPAAVRLGEHLVFLGMISEDELYEALSLQQCLPQTQLVPKQIEPAVVRALPASFIRRWRALPVRIEYGRITVASTDVPSDRMRMQLESLTGLEVRFHLITPTNFQQAAADLM